MTRQDAVKPRTLLARVRRASEGPRESEDKLDTNILSIYIGPGFGHQSVQSLMNEGRHSGHGDQTIIVL